MLAPVGGRAAWDGAGGPYLDAAQVRLVVPFLVYSLDYPREPGFRGQVGRPGREEAALIDFNVALLVRHRPFSFNLSCVIPITLFSEGELEVDASVEDVLASARRRLHEQRRAVTGL